MQHTAHFVRRGAVLLSGKRCWLLWDTNRPLPLCMPIRGQATPRSRWDYRLQAQHAPLVPFQAPMICAAAAREIETHGMTLLGVLADSALAELGQAIARAIESEMTEAKYRM